MAETENNFLEGNGIIILLLFFLMFGWGGGAWGGNGVNSAATQGALTRAEMSDAFNMNEVQRNQSDIKEQINALNTAIMQNRYDTALGIANTNQQIAENRYQAALQAQTAQAQMSTCCCDLKTAVHAEGEAIRALIQQQTIDDLKQQLNTATAAVSNAVQTQNITQSILGNMGRWVSNPAVNPYTAYSGCGCSGSYA